MSKWQRFKENWKRENVIQKHIRKYLKEKQSVWYIFDLSWSIWTISIIVLLSLQVLYNNPTISDIYHLLFLMIFSIIIGNSYTYLINWHIRVKVFKISMKFGGR